MPFEPAKGSATPLGPCDDSNGSAVVLAPLSPSLSLGRSYPLEGSAGLVVGVTAVPNPDVLPALAVFACESTRGSR